MIINCKQYANEILEEVKNTVKEQELKLTLAIVTCGTSAASETYIKNKMKKCNEIGIEALLFNTDDFISCKEMIQRLNKNNSIDKIILQLPTKLTKEEEKMLINMISYSKDIDGLTDKSKIAQFLKNENLPCTSLGVVYIIEKFLGTKDLSGKRIALYGRSDLVNKPLINKLLSMNATVTIYHSKSMIGTSLSPMYDIHIVAIGKPRFYKITEAHKKQIIIDVGINRDINNKLCGDVNTIGYENSDNIIYTPVPRGVGLLTTAMLCYKMVGGDNNE